MHSYIYVGTSSVVRVDGLSDTAGNPVDGASVQVTDMRDFRGRGVPGLALPLSLTGLGGGRYEAEIGPISVRPGHSYRMTVRADTGAVESEWLEVVRAKRRQG